MDMTLAQTLSPGASGHKMARERGSDLPRSYLRCTDNIRPLQKRRQLKGVLSRMRHRLLISSYWLHARLRPLGREGLLGCRTLLALVRCRFHSAARRARNVSIRFWMLFALSSCLLLILPLLPFLFF